MRGFIMTILSISIVMILIILAMSFYNSRLSMERVLLEPLPLIYSASLFDDIGFEINSMLGPEIQINTTNQSVRLGLSDTVHLYNHTPEILAYQVFLTEEVSARTASSISTNFSNLTNGTISLFINEDYFYSNDHNETEILFTRDGGTGATLYNISFLVTAVRASTSPMIFSDNGTLNVSITYTDLNGTETLEGKVFPEQSNNFRVYYADGSEILVKVGQEAGNSGSLLIDSSNISADVSFETLLPPIDSQKRVGYEYDAMVGYIQGNIAKISRIGR